MAQGSRKRPVPMLLARKLRRIRMRLGVGQAEMARLLSSTPSPPDGGMVSRFERGEREPNLFVLLAYSKIAKVNPGVLIDDAIHLATFDRLIPKDIEKRDS